MISFHPTLPRNSWPLRVGIAAGSQGCALLLTHAFWPVFQHTPFLLGFGAAIFSSRVGGRTTGFLAVVIGAVLYASFPPPLSEGGFGVFVGFVVVSGIFSWLVARRYEIEGALRSSESRLAEGQRVAHIGNWEWNVRDGSDSWSDQLYRIYGVEPHSIKPSFEAFSQFLHPDDRATVTSVVKRAFAEHQPFQCDNRIIRPDGEIRAIHVQGRVVLDEGGRVLRLIGTTQDITDRKAAEEIVSRSERRLQTIIDAEPACVKLVSADGLLLEMNRAGLAMIGAESLNQVAGRSIVDLVHPDDRSAFLERHRAAINGAESRAEFRMLGLSGSERWVDSHVVPFETSVSGSETERAALSVTSDVTDRKQLEEQLRQSQQMEAVGRLAAGIAHDFNNLLTAISGFTEFVLVTLEETDSRRADLYEVRKASARGVALTRQLLLFSRRQILQTKVFDLNVLVSDIEKLLHRTIGDQIELVMTFDPALEPVRADPTQLEQVVMNLAINARDAMPKGGTLRLTTEMVDVDVVEAGRRAPVPAGRYVRLTIADTGTGISPEIQPHIFEPFFTTKEPNKGTGLGLAMVYDIVKQSRGHVWVTSEVGCGTSFEIYLPAVHEAVEPLVRVEVPASLTGGDETILLAEDDGAVRRLASIALRRHGYTVLEARDGEEALQLARSNRDRDIHLLITDVVMPGVSGRDLAVQLAAERPIMRVLYTSGYADAVTMRAGLANGVPLLAKPFLPNELVQQVRESLDRPAALSPNDRPLDDWMAITTDPSDA